MHFRPERYLRTQSLLFTSRILFFDKDDPYIWANSERGLLFWKKKKNLFFAQTNLGSVCPRIYADQTKEYCILFNPYLICHFDPSRSNGHGLFVLPIWFHLFRAEWCFPSGLRALCIIPNKKTLVAQRLCSCSDKKPATCRGYPNYLRYICSGLFFCWIWATQQPVFWLNCLTEFAAWPNNTSIFIINLSINLHIPTQTYLKGPPNQFWYVLTAPNLP